MENNISWHPSQRWARHRLPPLLCPPQPWALQQQAPPEPPPPRQYQQQPQQSPHQQQRRWQNPSPPPYVQEGYPHQLQPTQQQHPVAIWPPHQSMADHSANPHFQVVPLSPHAQPHENVGHSPLGLDDLQFKKDCDRLSSAIEQCSAASVRHVVQNNWTKSFLGCPSHETFVLKTLLNSISPDIVGRSIRDFCVQGQAHVHRDVPQQPLPVEASVPERECTTCCRPFGEEPPYISYNTPLANLTQNGPQTAQLPLHGVPMTAPYAGLTAYSHLSENQRFALHSELQKCQLAFAEKVRDAEGIPDPAERQKRLRQLTRSYNSRKSFIRKTYGVCLRKRHPKRPTELARMGLPEVTSACSSPAALPSSRIATAPTPLQADNSTASSVMNHAEHGTGTRFDSGSQSTPESSGRTFVKTENSCPRLAGDHNILSGNSDIPLFAGLSTVEPQRRPEVQRWADSSPALI